MTAEVPEKSWELSHYEMHRKAQPLMSSKEAPTTVSSKVSTKRFATQNTEAYFTLPNVFQCVHSDLRCPICLDLLTSTMTTKECLHRFCAECIITALRSGGRQIEFKKQTDVLYLFSRQQRVSHLPQEISVQEIPQT